MKLKVSKILQIYQALKEFDGKAIPFKLSFRLGRLEDKIRPIVERYDKINIELITTKYGTPVEGKEGQYSVPADKMEELSKEVTPILDQDEDIDFTIKLELFEGVNVSKDFFIALGDLVTE